MKIITALKNPIINNKLNSIPEFEIIGNDIQYQDGIIEMLEKNGKIDLIIISEILPGNKNFQEIINKIKTINNDVEIIVFLKEKNEEIKNFLISKGIFNIFINNEITIEELIKTIKEKNKTIKENEIISVSGTNGSGKSIFSSIITKLIINKKILLIDFDFYNKSLNTNFGIKEYYKKDKKTIEKTISNLIIKLNKNIDLLFAMDRVINKNKTKYILEKLSKNYDVIIIDTNPEKTPEYAKEIYANSDEIVFLTEANLIQLKKSKNLLEIIINEWNIKKDKINIIFNKTNINSIDNKILKILFSDFNFLGELRLSNNYDFLINNNLKNIYINKKIKKEFKKIINKLNLGGNKNGEHDK